MHAPLGLELVLARIAGPDPPHHPEEGTRAAVSVVLRQGAEEAEVLLIRRAEDERDPWSGHMAFPGGRKDEEDADLLATALRETREEVGLALDAQARRIGRLPDLPAMARGRRVGMVITPYVFALAGDRPELTLNGEVAEAIWAPLGPMARREVEVKYPYVFEGNPLELPGYQVGPHVVWGLTYRMLETLFEKLR